MLCKGGWVGWHSTAQGATGGSGVGWWDAGCLWVLVWWLWTVWLMCVCVCRACERLQATLCWNAFT